MSKEAANGGRPGRRLAPLTLAAVGVVFGDIGTSPLYALRECFHGDYAVAVTPAAVEGVLSLIFWSLVLVVSVKYLAFVVRADNDGEGGVLALAALVADRPGRAGRVLWLVGIFGAGLLYGDGAITPAISVLSAVEGAELIAPSLQSWALPITVVILVALFLFQRFGTLKVGFLFGPITALWLLTIGGLGLAAIIAHPQILWALGPQHAVHFLIGHGWAGFMVLGAVFLVVTGAEALYADMGHFGRSPIRLAWFGLVFPCLLLDYFGQGATVLADPSSAPHAFYALVPSVLRIPVVVLATCATVIASQAVISGAFSLTSQAIQMGYLPRLRVVHTSRTEIGQIYVPAVNWILMVCTVGLVLGFRTSSGLAAAYGVAVTATMLATTLLFSVFAVTRMGWSRAAAGALFAVFACVDLAFLAANLGKITHGAWFPLALGGLTFAILTTWKTGREKIRRALYADNPSLEALAERVERAPPSRVPGLAAYLAGSPRQAPPALMQNLRHNQVLHENVVVVTVEFRDVPRVPLAADKVTVEAVRPWLYRVHILSGYMEDPHVPRLLTLARKQGLPFDPARASYFIGRERIVPGAGSAMPRWRELLFAFLSRNAMGATSYFKLPPDRVMELGARVEI